VSPGFDEPAPNVLAAAVQWLDATLLGTIATTIAVIAVASIGFLLLSGRVDVRRTAQVILGCFILFGASSIAAGIMRAVNADGSPAEIQAPPLPPPNYPPATSQTRPAAAAYDPYAGAALPSR
jgi:type IV secretory pathway VirB2 component (pilin)